jgi:hypothetical protein
MISSVVTPKDDVVAKGTQRPPVDLLSSRHLAQSAPEKACGKLELDKFVDLSLQKDKEVC